jgi:ribonuclease P protein component
MVSELAWRRAVDKKSSRAGARKVERGSRPEAGSTRVAQKLAARGFTREQRLLNSSEFGRVLVSGVRSADRFFTVLACAGSTGTARLGLTISRRSAKRAVDRSTLKRLAREAFRSSTLPAWDFVVMSKPGAAAADKRALRESLDAHFAHFAARARR